MLAAVLLAMPLTAQQAPVYLGLSYRQIEFVSLIGLATGWIVLDRLAALRLPIVAMVLTVIAVVAGCWLISATIVVDGLPFIQPSATIIAVSFVGGGLIRGATIDRRSMASLVAIAAATSWLTHDIPRLPIQPLRDIHLYLSAGAKALDGASPYLDAPLGSITHMDQLPFIYPPLTIPLFELLASVPRPLADAIWVSSSIVAVVAALWLLGVRGRWLVVLLAWPPIALGIAVGNVASFTFFLYVAGFRVGAALILGGVFKFQSTIPALWLVRERKWRSIAAGVGILAVLALIAVPLVGLHAWIDWLNGLLYFQESLTLHTGIPGLALARRLGPTVAIAATVLVVGYGLLGRGRNGLARLGLASVVASPTLYLHGFSPLLAGALSLGPELLWFFLGLGDWSWHRLPFIWLGFPLVGLALLVARGSDLRPPADLTPSRADMHPAARTGQVWPE